MMTMRSSNAWLLPDRRLEDAIVQNVWFRSILGTRLFNIEYLRYMPHSDSDEPVPLYQERSGREEPSANGRRDGRARSDRR